MADSKFTRQLWLENLIQKDAENARNAAREQMYREGFRVVAARHLDVNAPDHITLFFQRGSQTLVHQVTKGSASAYRLAALVGDRGKLLFTENGVALRKQAA